MKRVAAAAFLLLFIVTRGVGQATVEKVDTLTINLIKDEGLNRSRVMEILSNLTDVYGPRLTGSPEYKQAAEWAAKTLEEWGLRNVHFDRWGPFGRGWTLKRFNANVLQPRAFPLIAYPKAWSPGTKGTVTGDVVYLDVASEADFEKYRGKLKGKFVLISEPRDLKAHFEPAGTRLTDSELLKMANAGMPAAGPPRRMPNLARMSPAQRDSAAWALARMFMPDADSTIVARMISSQTIGAKKLQFVQQEGAAVVLDVGRGDGGTLFVAGATVPQDPSTPFGQRIGAHDPKAPQIAPQVTVAAEHYNRLVRMIQKGQSVKMEMNLEVQFTPPDSGFNIIAEIPGTDLKDEIVMVGAHFDSWHAGTGATDNATGSAACMEAVRILQKLGLKPRRTIRIGLWGGEEQGLLGSRAFVAKHLAERSGGMMGTMGDAGVLTKKAEYEKFSVYFNHDNGTGKLRGVYMQGNEAARPIFRAWLAPFESMGASTLTLSNTGGTDHLAFDGVGLPGFQFIQDPIEYSTRTHHSNMDVYDRVQEEDMKQAAVIIASFAYQAAMRDGLFPRKPMPAPQQTPQLPGGN